MPSKTNRFIQRFPKLHRAYERFVKIRGNPRQIGLGFALGLFFGMSPFLGLHSIVAVVLAALFGWSKIAALTGVWISNPLTFPFIYSFTWWVGAGVTRTSATTELPPPLDPNYLAMLIKNSPQMLYNLVVGGVVVGLPLAVAGYFAAFWLVEKYRRKVNGRLHLPKIRQRQRATPSELDPDQSDS